MRKIALLIIKIYRFLLSPLFPPCCRFHPTCSQYTEEAISRFGVLRGGLLALWRLLRCHPLHPGGYDPVPQKFTFRSSLARDLDHAKE